MAERAKSSIFGVQQAMPGRRLTKNVEQNRHIGGLLVQ
jgi:hypothetical protein